MIEIVERLFYAIESGSPGHTVPRGGCVDDMDYVSRLDRVS